VARADATFIIDSPGHCAIPLSFINLYLIHYIAKMTSNQPTLMPNDVIARQPGQPKIYANKEIKERRKEQMRQYLNKNKEKKVNKPKSSVVVTLVYIPMKRQSSTKEIVSGDIIRKTESAASSNQRDVNSIARPRP